MKAQSTARACVYCYTKKIRCVGAADQGGCFACRSASVPCYSRTRKKRQMTRLPTARLSANYSSVENVSDSIDSTTTPGSDLPLLASPIHTQPHMPQQKPSTAPQMSLVPNSRIASAADLAQPNTIAFDAQGQRYNSRAATPAGGVGHHPPTVEQLSLREQPNEHPETPTTFIGRDHYIREGEHIDETTARAFHASGVHGPSDLVAQTLQQWKVFEVPTKSARQSLVDSYRRRCYPWTPVLEKQDDTRIIDQVGSSMFLCQCLFLAASRVSSSPMVTAYATSQQFYERAKALFWLSHEKDPLIVLKGTLMLHWFNPDGPEHLSFDSSEFWLKIGVGIAHQIGLHREDTGGNLRALRRRLWWSLVVSYTRRTLRFC